QNLFAAVRTGVGETRFARFGVDPFVRTSSRHFSWRRKTVFRHQPRRPLLGTYRPDEKGGCLRARRYSERGRRDSRGTGDNMMAPATPIRRPENLGLIYQEVLTAIVRLRGDRQSVSDPAAFRHHTRDALKAAANQALAAGYATEDVKLATFAAVAFLDEAILNSKKPIFADWLKKPLQEELFGTHVAGGVFFQKLQQLLERTDSPDLADLLEIYQLCLLLGFVGRYSSSPGEVKRMKDLAAEKIERIRGRSGPLAPVSMLPDEGLPRREDPWVRRLAITSIAGIFLVIALFASYKIILKTPISALSDMAAQVGK